MKRVNSKGVTHARKKRTDGASESNDLEKHELAHGENVHTWVSARPKNFQNWEWKKLGVFFLSQE